MHESPHTVLKRHGFVFNWSQLSPSVQSSVWFIPAALIPQIEVRFCCHPHWAGRSSHCALLSEYRKRARRWSRNQQDRFNCWWGEFTFSQDAQQKNRMFCWTRKVQKPGSFDSQILRNKCYCYYVQCSKKVVLLLNFSLLIKSLVELMSLSCEHFGWENKKKC